MLIIPVLLLHGREDETPISIVFEAERALCCKFKMRLRFCGKLQYTAVMFRSGGSIFRPLSGSFHLFYLKDHFINAHFFLSCSFLAEFQPMNCHYIGTFEKLNWKH